MRLTLIIILILFFPIPTLAGVLTGYITRVIDGDTVVVQDVSRAQYEIQLSGIDAPELNQPYGEASKDRLSDTLTGRFVVINYNQRGPNGRIVGKILFNSQDVNFEQVKAGLAWYTRDDTADLSEADRREYALVEVEARKARRGLWLDETPQPPWLFRTMTP